ncbi:hypothetical protein LUZ60_014025 [Juncus effusus]|nr:hypothetical protein LUZ60_014025 [Juncus effusus]
MASLSFSLNSSPCLKTGIHLSTQKPVSRFSYFKQKIECKDSRVGKKPIQVPSSVDLKYENGFISVKGPLGELSRTYPNDIKIERENDILRVSKAFETRRAHQMHGLFRTLIDNMVVGVSKGFEKKLLLIGVGYRAQMEGNDLVLFLGFSHPVRMTVPAGLQVKVEENTRVVISGYNKQSLGEFAADVRKWRPPEPYKGKGIRYSDEVVRKKEGKAGKKK